MMELMPQFTADRASTEGVTNTVVRGRYYSSQLVACGGEIFSKSTVAQKNGSREQNHAPFGVICHHFGQT